MARLRLNLPPALALWVWQAAKSFGRGFGRLPRVLGGCQLALEAEKMGFGGAPEEAETCQKGLRNLSVNTPK